MVDCPTLTGKVLAIADRGYESHNLLAHIMTHSSMEKERTPHSSRLLCYDLIISLYPQAQMSSYHLQTK
jgi:hypothetical protein